MRKRSMLIKATNWHFLFSYKLRRIQNRNLWYTIQTLFEWRRAFAHPCFLYENESFHHSLSYDLWQMATFWVLEVQFFQQLRFLGGPFFPGLGCRFRSGFQTMSILMNEDNWWSPKVTTEIITTRHFHLNGISVCDKVEVSLI